MKPTSQTTYSEDELGALFATHFGDKLSQTQLDSLVVTVLHAHADRRARSAKSAEDTSPVAQPSHVPGPRSSGQATIKRLFSAWPTTQAHQMAEPG